MHCRQVTKWLRAQERSSPAKSTGQQRSLGYVAHRETSVTERWSELGVQEQGRSWGKQAAREGSKTEDCDGVGLGGIQPVFFQTVEHCCAGSGLLLCISLKMSFPQVAASWAFPDVLMPNCRHLIWLTCGRAGTPQLHFTLVSLLEHSNRLGNPKNPRDRV